MVVIIALRFDKINNKVYSSIMEHRHLNGNRLGPAAIDDIISRGKMDDWLELGLALKEDSGLEDLILRVCSPKIQDKYEQRYHFWNNYVLSVQKKRTT